MYLRPFEHAADDESIKPAKSFHSIRVDHPGILKFLYQQKLLNDIKHHLGYNSAKLYPFMDLDEIWDTTSIWSPDPNNPMMWAGDNGDSTTNDENDDSAEAKIFPPYPKLDKIRNIHWRSLELPEGYELVTLDNIDETNEEEEEDFYEPPLTVHPLNEYLDEDSEDDYSFGGEEKIVERRLSQVSSQSLEELFRQHDKEFDEFTCGVNCSTCRRFFYERKQHYGLNDQREKWESDHMAVSYVPGSILSNRGNTDINITLN